MKPQTFLMIATVALVAFGQEPANKPSPQLEEAAKTANRAWSATTKKECQAAIDLVFADPMELFLTTEQFSIVLPRTAMLEMANELDKLGGMERAWETEDEGWFLSERMAVRKARERLLEGAEVKSIFTTNVFELRHKKWVLVHAHHSEYQPNPKKR